MRDSPLCDWPEKLALQGECEGGKAGAVIYSLLETAKSYDHNPIEYFTDILKKLPIAEKFDDLLPNTWNPPVTKA